MTTTSSRPTAIAKPNNEPSKNNGKDARAIRYDFLQSSPDTTKTTKTDVNFTHTDLPELDGLYATVIDNCFTEAECNSLVSLAEAHSNGIWEQAMINIGGGKQEISTDSRDCGRIIWDDVEIVQKIWSRVKDFVPEIHALSNAPKITGNWAAMKKETWRVEKLNERMRFLKYGAGQYFRPHCDAHYRTLDREQMSYFTLHLYLNGSADGQIGGGATTFHSINMQRQYDVAPKTGRVLIFQQRNLLHSGADVTSGTKLTLRTDLMYKKVTE